MEKHWKKKFFFGKRTVQVDKTVLHDVYDCKQIQNSILHENYKRKRTSNDKYNFKWKLKLFVVKLKKYFRSVRLIFCVSLKFFIVFLSIGLLISDINFLYKSQVFYTEKFCKKMLSTVGRFPSNLPSKYH